MLYLKLQKRQEIRQIFKIKEGRTSQPSYYTYHWVHHAGDHRIEEWEAQSSACDLRSKSKVKGPL